MGPPDPRRALCMGPPSIPPPWVLQARLWLLPPLHPGLHSSWMGHSAPVQQFIPITL